MLDITAPRRATGSNAREEERSLQQTRTALAARLRARRPHLDEAIYAHVRRIGFEPSAVEDAEYMGGLRLAVEEIVDRSLAVIEWGEPSAEAMPPAAIAQVRRAARHGVRLETILRCHAAGDRLLGDFLMDEAERLSHRVLREVMRAQGAHLDRLMASVAAVYEREIEQAERSPVQLRAERVRRILVGESVDTADLGYQIEDWWHIGLIVTGARARQAVRDLAAAVNRELLCVSLGERTEWAWLGGRHRLEVADVERRRPVDATLCVAIGEPAQGIDGWRQTHRQAQAAMRIVLRRPQEFTRFADVLLLSSVLADETLAKSLQEIYLTPFDGTHDRGKASRETLRAYMNAGCNAATAAAALKVNRHTVERRLRVIEERLGRLVRNCHAELEVALRLEELGSATHGPHLSPAE